MIARHALNDLTIGDRLWRKTDRAEHEVVMPHRAQRAITVRPVENGHRETVAYAELRKLWSLTEPQRRTRGTRS